MSYIPSCPQWVRVSVGAATTSAVISKLGIAHPPAAAMTVLYLSPGNNQWMNYALTLSVVVSVFIATFINNFPNKNQYPTDWTGPLLTCVMRCKMQTLLRLSLSRRGCRTERGPRSIKHTTRFIQTTSIHAAVFVDDTSETCMRSIPLHPSPIQRKNIKKKV